MTNNQAAVRLGLFCSVALGFIAAPAAASAAEETVVPTGSNATQSTTSPQATSGSPVPADQGEIIVTAQKRKERVLEVPGAISAFRGTDLLKSGATSVADLVGLAPGLQFAGGLGSGAPVLRGISQGFEFGAATGVVVQGAPIGASSGLVPGGFNSLDLDPIELERVEVLKGPQGTLYGANTLAGLISYVLREPSLERPEVLARVSLADTAHGALSYSARAVASAPLVTDKAALQLSGYYERRGGFIDNNARGIENQNKHDNWGGRATLLLAPTEALRINLSGIYQRTDEDARDVVAYNRATSQPRDGDLQYNEFVLPAYAKRTRVLLGTVDYDFGFATLTSVTSYQKIDTRSDVNFSRGTLTSILAGFLPLFGGVTFPAPPLVRGGQNLDMSKFTQELRLTSAGTGPLSWIAGVFYNHEDNKDFTPLNAALPNGGLASGINPVLQFNLFSKLREISAFGDVTYTFSPQFDVTGGVRVGDIKQRYSQLFFGSDANAYNTLLTISGLATVPAQIGPIESSKTITNYLATARYHFSRDGMLFARFATGYRPGGPNVSVPGLPSTFEPDRTNNYELGVKSRFWDGRGTIDLTGYYTQWKNIVVAASSGGLTGFANGGDARVYGVEAALSLRPVQGLSLDGTLAYSNGKITRSDPRFASSSAAGDTLPYNPKWSGSLTGSYRTRVNERWGAIFSASGRFVGERLSSLAGNKTTPLYVLPSYALFDLHAGLESQHFDVDFFVKNLTDKRAQLSAYTSIGFPEVTVQQPRTIGIALTAKY